MQHNLTGKTDKQIEIEKLYAERMRLYRKLGADIHKLQLKSGNTDEDLKSLIKTYKYQTYKIDKSIANLSKSIKSVNAQI
jgi:hypothetical protein